MPFPLYMFSLIVVASTILLIVAGGLVTSHEAGLAVPDWPRSYGQWFPPMIGNVFWEHGHRLIAGSVGILTFLLTLWIQLQEKRVWLKKLAWAAFLAVLLQALLGGLTVLYLLPVSISVFHATLGQTFFCLIAAVAYYLSPAFLREQKGGAAEDAKIKRLLMLIAFFVYLQLILGAVIRHSPFTVVPHVILAFLIFLHVGLALMRILNGPGFEKTLSRSALGLGLLTVIQVFLGMGAFIFTRMLPRGYSPSSGSVLFATAHQTVGALILAASVLMILMTRR